MKTFRLFASVLMVALCVTFVTSCSDDDDDENYPASIVGIWKGKSNLNNNYVLEVETETKAYLTIADSDGEIYETENLTYSYDSKTGKVISDYDGTTVTAKVNNNTMTFSFSNEKVTLTKQ